MMLKATRSWNSLIINTRSVLCRSLSGNEGGRNSQVYGQSSGETDQKPSSKHIDKSRLPEINEQELLEKFVGGSGPGGQSVNKSVNACQLKHLPTGIVVKVHQTRSLEMNRKIAREILQHKLDKLYNGELSVDDQKKRLDMHKMAMRDSQARKRRELKEQFKQRMQSNGVKERVLDDLE